MTRGTHLFSAAEETIEAIDRLFPTELGEAAGSGLSPRLPPANEQWQRIAARRTGYIQSVDGDAFLRLTREWNVVIRMEAGIGETAVICVDYLTAILARLAPRELETPFRMDQGQLRVIARGPTFRSLLEEAFDQIRQNSEGNAAVLARLIQVLNIIAGLTDHEERRQALQLHADLVLETVERSVSSPHDGAIHRVSGLAKPMSSSPSEGKR